MLDIHFDTSEFDELARVLANMGKHITESDYDRFMRKALKPMKEKVRALQPKSINSSRYSYSAAQRSIEKYGLLEKALGVSKSRKKDNIGEHSFFVEYSKKRGAKAFVSVFLNYGTGSKNFLKRLQFMQKAERSMLATYRQIMIKEMQDKVDTVFAKYR